MRIHLLCQFYSPEEVSVAVLVKELATDLTNRGHLITVITCAPNYPYGRVQPGYRNRLYQVEQLEGVRVVRTWTRISPKKTFWSRMLNYGSYCSTALYGGLLAGKPDIVVSYSPPLPLGLTAWMLSRLWRVPWVLQLMDIYPEAAVAAGVFTNPYAIRFFEAMESFINRKATQISIISESFRSNLLKKGVKAHKLAVIPVWGDPDIIRPSTKNTAFKTHHGLAGQFVVMYAGNLGYTSSLEDMLDAAYLLKEISGITFVIVGEGVKKDGLQKRALQHNLRNVLFLPYEPRESFPDMLASADISVVTLNYRSSLSSFPSKLFNLMASARPILAVAPQGSELAQLIRKADCGLTVPPGTPAFLREAILRLKEDQELMTRMGRNGRAKLINDYSRIRCIGMHERMLKSVCHDSSRCCESRTSLS